MILHSYYLNRIIPHKHRRDSVAALELTIEHNKLIFDAIACRGLSGILAAVPLAEELDKTLCIVRKMSEPNHGNYIEATGVPRRYIIVDDFKSCGETINTILQRMKKRFPQSECAGILCYSSELDKEHNMWIEEEGRDEQYPIYGMVLPTILTEESATNGEDLGSLYDHS